MSFQASPWIENNVPAVKVEEDDEDSAELGVEIKKEPLDDSEIKTFRGQTPFDLACQNLEVSISIRLPFNN